MRVVLDACVPQPLRHDIIGHDVVTTRYLGLHELDDGELIEAIQDAYDVFVTCDRSIPWQNSFAGRPIALIVLRARTNALEDLQPLVPNLLIALDEIHPGEVREIAA